MYLICGLYTNTHINTLRMLFYANKNQFTLISFISRFHMYHAVCSTLSLLLSLSLAVVEIRNSKLQFPKPKVMGWPLITSNSKYSQPASKLLNAFLTYGILKPKRTKAGRDWEREKVGGEWAFIKIYIDLLIPTASITIWMWHFVFIEHTEKKTHISHPHTSAFMH